MNDVKAATAAMNGHVPMSTRLLRIEPNANCEGGMMLGLTHQRQNLECALQLAAYRESNEALYRMMDEDHAAHEPQPQP